jgi:hypothetical protein
MIIEIIAYILLISAVVIYAVVMGSVIIEDFSKD